MMTALIQNHIMMPANRMQHEKSPKKIIFLFKNGASLLFDVGVTKKSAYFFIVY